MIIDTSFIIDFLKHDKDAVNKMKGFLERNEPIKTTTISVFEVWQGTLDIGNDSEKEKIEKFLSSIGLLVFDIESAKRAGTIYSGLKSKGELIEGEDCMIAGITLNLNEVLLTRNKKHFEKIQGLKIESY